MPDTDDDAGISGVWKSAAGFASALVAGMLGMFDQVFAVGGELLTLGGLEAITTGIYANAPTLFTMLSVAQSQFQSFLHTIAPAAVWQTATVAVGVMFLLAMADRLTEDFRRRLRE